MYNSIFSEFHFFLSRRKMRERKYFNFLCVFWGFFIFSSFLHNFVGSGNGNFSHKFGVFGKDFFKVFYGGFERRFLWIFLLYLNYAFVFGGKMGFPLVVGIDFEGRIKKHVTKDFLDETSMFKHFTLSLFEES